MTRIRIEREEGIGRVVLARPERQNTLDQQAAEEIFAALDALEADATVRVIHLTADGDDFCAGMDMEAMNRLLPEPPEVQRKDAESLGRVFLAMRAMMKPLVCSVRGRALSGGAGLAIACDIVLADAEAEFGFPDVRVGFVPALVLPMLRRVIGERRAADMILTGRILDADEAERIGLVSRVLPSVSFADEVNGVLRGIARLSPTSLALSKWLLYKMDSLSFEDGVAAGVVTNVEARGTDDFRAALRRFNGPEQTGEE